MNAIVSYFQGAVSELKRVTWPTEKEVSRITRITVVFLLVFSLVFFFSDTVLGLLFRSMYSFF